MSHSSLHAARAATITIVIASIRIATAGITAAGHITTATAAAILYDARSRGIIAVPVITPSDVAESQPECVQSLPSRHAKLWHCLT